MVVSSGWFSRRRVVLFLIYNVVAFGLMLLGSSPSSADEQTGGDAPKPTGEDRYFENSIGMKFRLIPAGEFMMGFATSEQRHKVRITKPFYLGITEVTQQQYEKVMRSNPSHFSKTGGGSDDIKGIDTSSFPVENVSWDDAVEFCARFSAKEGRTYRLPTEAEREYACPAGTASKWCSGNCESRLSEYAWFGKDAGGTPHPVERKKPNAWGFHEMHGNVWEWCRDWYWQDSIRKSEEEDPTGPATDYFRVGRRGSWCFDARCCRSSHRWFHRPTDRSRYQDFRVVAVPYGRRKWKSHETR